MIATHQSESRLEDRLIAEHGNSNVVDFAVTLDSERGLVTLKARFAIAGHHVHEGSSDDFIVSRWGLSRYCPDLAALTQFARVVGA